MLIKLTNKCYEGCSHCMENSNPNGENMSWDVIRDLVRFINDNFIRILVLSGGEFTTDPEFYEKILYISKSCRSSVMSLQSNGSFIFNKEKTDKIIKLSHLDNIECIQVSTHKRYYPNYDKIIKEKEKLESINKVLFVEGWQGSINNIHRLGRAVNLKDEPFKGSPSCSPVISRSNQIDKILGRDISEIEFSDFISYLTMCRYLCKPLINEYGDMYVGECQFCTKVGSIKNYRNLNKESIDELCNNLMKSLYNMKMCDKCGEVKNLKGKVPDIVINLKSFKVL